MTQHNEPDYESTRDKREQAVSTDLSIHLSRQSKDAGTYQRVDNDGREVPSAETSYQLFFRNFFFDLFVGFRQCYLFILLKLSLVNQ